ncbi:DUF4157 domain-containing protein [Flavobacterium sp.]|uniref:eCIS core domain-containing protein n=1 Tax=Flavobacterium sp. TaxID=239 RepID=UPI00374CFBEF
MENSYDNKKSLKAQSAANLNTKIIQNKAIELQDNRPASILQKKANNSGLPENLKSGLENLSGHSLDDVKVHYNSGKPAQLQAHAYAQGTDIHIASGQEKHLPHEAWHVVQQKQGRVKPTLQMKGKVNVNDDKGLEKEADVMGAKALTVQRKENATAHNSGCGCAGCSSQSIQMKSPDLVQRQKKDVIQLICKHGKIKNCKSCQQSADDRNVNKLGTYQTPHKNAKKQQEREDAVKGYKGAIAHGSGNSGSKQSNKMTQILKKANGK